MCDSNNSNDCIGTGTECCPALDTTNQDAAVNICVTDADKNLNTWGASDEYTNTTETGAAANDGVNVNCQKPLAPVIDATTGTDCSSDADVCTGATVFCCPVTEVAGVSKVCVADAEKNQVMWKDA